MLAKKEKKNRQACLVNTNMFPYLLSFIFQFIPFEFYSSTFIFVNKGKGNQLAGIPYLCTIFMHDSIKKFELAQCT